jgi:hypothetical protein
VAQSLIGQKKFGYSIPEWDETRDQVRSVLSQFARESRLISYSELAQRVGPIRFQPDAHAYHAMLGEVSASEDEQGRGMLTVLVVHKEGDALPGQGFFELAERLDRNATDHLAFWAAELQRVLSAHKENSRSQAF